MKNDSHRSYSVPPEFGRPEVSGSWQPAPPRAPRQGRRLKLHVGLFLATVASTFFAGYYSSADVGQAASFSAAIMAILLLHEMGHFVLCLRYRVPATLPYFIPFPLSLFGTLGAVIAMKGQLRSRRSIFDIGAAGPLAGLVVAIPIVYFGLKISTIVFPGDEALEGSLMLGDSILFALISEAALGPLPPGADLLLHPLALAGWAGLLITGINLLPIGQLDGGHILYAMLGDRALWVSRFLLVLLAGLTIFMHRGWWLMLVLLVLVMRGGRHPPAENPAPLDRSRMILGLVMMALFVLTFVPRPITVNGP